MAIEHGFTVLSWFESRPKDEIPPEHLWDDPKGLERWWEKIEQKKEYASSAGVKPEDVKDEDLVDNELARSLKD